MISKKGFSLTKAAFFVAGFAVTSQANAEVIAYTSSQWFSHTKTQPEYGIGAAGSWKLGTNYVRYEFNYPDLQPTDVPTRPGDYATGGGTAEANPDPQDGSSGYARSRIKVGDPVVFYDYEMSAVARASSALFFGPEVQSYARGNDPQPITGCSVEFPCVFENEIGFLEGSSIYASDPSFAMATSLFQLTGPDLASAFASINLASTAVTSANPYGVDASVIFRDDSQISFYLPGESNPVSASLAASSVEWVLEHTASLGSLTGTGPMTLFSYEFTLTSPSGTFGSDLTSQAVTNAVPEPSSMSLLGVGVAALLMASVGRQMKRIGNGRD